MLTEGSILKALEHVQDPELNKSLVDLNMIRDIEIDARNNVSLTVVLTIVGCPLKATIEDDVTHAIQEMGANQVHINWGSMSDEERSQLADRLRRESSTKTNQSGAEQNGAAQISPLLAPDSKTQFIAVTSGKGGVGKSTVTVNLATALARQGKKVGIIDADIYGFSIPGMMGITMRPTVIDEVILPVEAHGVKVMSMGFFVHNNSPVIWRGPMLGKMLRNFFDRVYWNDIDYMVLDLPPGTGDVALDIHNLLPQSKEIIVTTPHAKASLVAARAGAMAIQTDNEILGVIENMSYYQLPDGSKDYIFGQGGGRRLVEAMKTDLLGQIPVGQPHPESSLDDTTPAIYPQDTPIGHTYTDIAANIVEKLEHAGKELSKK